MNTYSVLITEEDKWLVALEPISGVASQGKTLDEAMTNIREALTLYFEEVGDTAKLQPKGSTFLTTVSV